MSLTLRLEQIGTKVLEPTLQSCNGLFKRNFFQDFGEYAGMPLRCHEDSKRGRNKRRSADSASSDMVHPRRAASRLRWAITESSMFHVAFTEVVLRQRWLYAKPNRTTIQRSESAPSMGEPRRERPGGSASASC